MKIITFAAIKGGAGKTTALLMMAAELAEQGYKVLAADEDHQCNLTHYLIFILQKVLLLMYIWVEK